MSTQISPSLNNNSSDLMTPDEIIAYLKLDRKGMNSRSARERVLLLFRGKKIRASKIGRDWRARKDDVDAYVKKGQI